MIHKKLKKSKKSKKSKSRSSSKKDGAKESDSGAEDSDSPHTKPEEAPEAVSKDEEPNSSADIWRENQQTVEEKSRDEEFEEYLHDLFL